MGGRKRRISFSDHALKPRPAAYIGASMSRTSATTHPLATYRSEFPIFDRSIYLNSCSLGALSRRSRDKVAEFLATWDSRGAAAWYDAWWSALGELRAGYAAIVGAAPGEIALHASVSTATAVVAGAIDYSRRPKVVTSSLDFPTVVYQWLAKAGSGVELVIVESPDGISVPLDAWAKAVDDRTALVATSHVFFTSGAIQDVQAVARLAHRHGALCFVDAYQSAGQVPVDVRGMEVDFLTAGGLKWLLGGPGIVFLYMRADLAQALRPTVTGWFAHRDQFAFEPRAIEWQPDARRLELGTPALAAVFAQLGGLQLIQEIGLGRIHEVVQNLTADLIERAMAAGLRPKVAADPERRSAIIMLPSADPAAAVRRLATRQVIADARPGHVRLSPYFYNTEEDHAQAIETLST